MNRIHAGSKPSTAARGLVGSVSLAVLFFALSLGAACVPEPWRIGPYLQTVTRDSAMILWETTAAQDSKVEYGLTAQYGQTVYSPATVQLHEVQLTGLLPEKTYQYRVSSGGQVGSNHIFKTAVNESTPFQFAVYGDTQENPFVHGSIANAIWRESPALVLHVGDEILRGNEYERWLTEFFNPGKNLMFQIPVYVAIGNHEEDASWFYYYHSYPAPEDRYAFGYGNSYFVILDTNKDFSPGSEQYVWAEQTLSFPEAQQAKWRFVAHHHPAYSEGWNPCDGYDGDLAVRQYLVPLMETYGVDAVFNGHTHGYERGLLNGVTYVISGGGGGGLDHFCQDWPHVAVSQYVHHYVTVDVQGSTLTLEAHQSDGSVFDSVSIQK